MSTDVDPLRAWDDHYREVASIANVAVGAFEAMDANDEWWLLWWAREYGPQLVEQVKKAPSIAKALAEAPRTDVTSPPTAPLATGAGS